MDETEAPEIVVDFGKICRLCLTGEGVLINLFSMDNTLENENKSIPDRIMDLMSIKVIKDDGFPSWICHNCLSQIDKCYEFFYMCRTSQATLNESYISALSKAGVNVTLKEIEESYIRPAKQSEEFAIYYTKEDDLKLEVEADAEGPCQEVKNFCSDCSKIFLNEEEFFIHRVSVHHDDLITIDQESVKTEQESDSTGILTCDPCGAKFHKRNAIITHIRFKHLKTSKESNVEFKKLIFCKYCGLSFSRKNLTRHLEVIHRMSKNIDHDQKNVDCRICFRPFMRHSSLRSHAEKFHGDNLEMIAEAENCEIVWNCSECDSVFLEESLLMQHFGSKHSRYPLEVDGLRGLKSRNLICACGVISLNSFDASLHEIFYHSEEKSKENAYCPGCEKGFVGIEDLKIHLVSYHWFMSMTYENECVFCNLAFSSNGALRIHLNSSHEITFENSPEEDKFIKSKKEEEEEEEENEESIKKELKAGEPENEDTKEDQTLLVCQTCGEFYRSEEELQEHEKNCQICHICELCGKGYKTDNHLKRHIAEYHKTMSPIKCPLCPKVFPRKMNLHNHYKRRHLKQTKKFVCSYCGQSLKGKVALRSHEDRLHRNIRSYKCSECPEAFTTRSILRKHAQRHLSERPMLQCQYCEKKFSTISGIERHVKTHEGVKEFTCELPTCRKSFYTKSELKRHMKFHTRDFKHVCPVCNHKFMSPGELKKHSTKHTGERPFKCHLCPCAYARRDDKVKHLKRVHNLKVKRIYGKPLRKYSDEETDLIDTIVIDESCGDSVPENSKVIYSNVAKIIQ